MPASPSILVVDDVPANLGLLLETFCTSGFRVLVAESGESALEQLKHATPDVILLDYRLPGMDGLQTCKAIRAQPALQDLPILFLTAVDDLDAKVRVFEAGAVDYVTKPIQPREVLARVRTHLRIALLQRDLAEEIAMRREAEEQLQDSLDRALLVAGVDGRIQFASRLARTLLAKHFREPTTIHLPPPVRTALAAMKPAGAGVEKHTAVEVAPGLALRLLGNSGPGEPSVLELMAQEPAQPGLLVPLGLTPREAEVLFWLSEGKTNAEIGLILNSSRRTVEKHVEHILEKLGLENRGAATRMAIDTLRPLAPHRN